MIGLRSAALAIALAIALAPLPIVAQVIRGTVREIETEAPLSGAIVTLLDAAENRHVRSTLSDEHGRFILNAGAAGSYRIDVKRIGVKHTTSPVVTVAAGETREMELVVSPLPVAAMTVRIEEQARCGAGGAAASRWRISGRMRGRRSRPRACRRRSKT